MAIAGDAVRVESTLEILDITTGQREPLARFDYPIEAPNWSPDGTRLLYNSGGRLYWFHLATGASELVDTGGLFRCNNDHVLSRDGREIGISHHSTEDGKSRVYRLPVGGGVPRLVTPLGPSYLHGWSPDGGTLAYCADRGGDYDIYVMPADGGPETRLTESAGLNDGPEYAPDGRHIWFNSVRTGLMQIWRMEADGRQQEQMTFDHANSWFPHVSPDGSLVVFLSYRAGDVEPSDHPAHREVTLRLMASTGGSPRTLASLLGGQGTLNVNSWAPDSRRLAFVSYRRVLPDPETGELAGTS